MDGESRRGNRDTARDRFESIGRHGGEDGPIFPEAAAHVRIPVRRKATQDRLFGHRPAGLKLAFQIRLDRVSQRVDLCRPDTLARGIGLPEHRQLRDLLIQKGLRRGGIVHLAVAEAPVADEVDDDVAPEGVPVLKRDACGAGHRNRVLAVDVEDRHREPERGVGGVSGGVKMNGLGGEPDQVVHDHVNRSPDGESWKCRQVQGLPGDPLPGERRIPVQRDREGALRAVGSEARLPCAGAAHEDRVDGLEVARVGDEVDCDGRAAGSDELPRGPEVVLDVSPAQRASRIDVAKPREDQGRWNAHHPRHDGKPPAVAHPDERELGPRFGTRLECRIEQRHEGGGALEGVPLRSDVSRVQELLEQLDFREPPQDPVAVARGGFCLHAFRDEPATIRIGDVHEPRADRAAVDRPPVGAFRVARVVELGVHDRREPPQRVEVGLEVPPTAEGVGVSVAIHIVYLFTQGEEAVA
jgi:hypothetical protein